MFAKEFGVDEVPCTHPGHDSFSLERPFINQRFDFVICDGQVLRTHKRPEYRERTEANRLTSSQLILALQRIRHGGTLVILLHKIEALDTMELLYLFSHTQHPHAPAAARQQRPFRQRAVATTSRHLEYRVTPLPELDLPRATLHRFLSIRSSHGDFSWHHTKFAHEDAKLLCSCGHKKTPEHIVHCRKTTTASQFRKWPQRPPMPPTSRATGIDYLTRLMAKPADFAALLQVTEFYSKICT